MSVLIVVTVGIYLVHGGDGLGLVRYVNVVNLDSEMCHYLESFSSARADTYFLSFHYSLCLDFDYIMS